MFRRSVLFLPNGDVPTSGLDNESTSDLDNDTIVGIDNDGFTEDDESDRSDTLSDEGTELLGNESQDAAEGPGDRPKKNWDVFQVNIARKRQSSSLRFWNRVHVGVRITLCLVLFLLVLSTSSLSKLLFLVTAYNINATNKGNTTTDHSGEVRVNVTWLWSMIITVTAPYVFTVFRNFLRLIFKRHKSMEIIPFAVVLLFETCHSIGLCLFVFVVAPSVNPVIVLMLGQGVGIIPSVCKLSWTRSKTLGSPNTHETFATPVWRVISIVSCLLQASFIGVTSWRVYRKTSHPVSHQVSMVVLLLVSLTLISMRWWDNFIQRKALKRWEEKNKDSLKAKQNKSAIYRPSSLTDLLKHIDKNRVRIDLYVSVWKIILTLVIPAVVFGTHGEGCQDAFTLKSYGRAENCGIIPGFNNMTLISSEYNGCGDYLPFLITIISVLSSGIGYKMAKAACKIRSQVWCFSLPLALTTPMSYILVLITYSQPVSVSDYIGCHFSWFHLADSSDIFKYILKDCIDKYYFPIVIAGYVTILFLCAHVWAPNADRVAATDKLFNRPLYCGVFFDTSLMMNRRSDDSINIRHDNRRKKVTQEQARPNDQLHRSIGKIPMVYVCVTMWHETEVEMLQLLKSIFKMDQDQSTRRNMKEMLGTPDKDFYEMEAHIMFDNAFGNPKADEDPYLINEWVKKFVSTINQAASEVYISIEKLADPIKCITPYGGQLIWTMPGRNELIVHLKHQEKVRIKKRWSQVMYMYYLLSHKMVCREGIGQKSLSKMSKNTFILTLDGDVDFQPSAVQMLLDRMKKNSNVGAACGRIHPIGAGPVVWYQKFEYAMSHWLQKAAEHVIGCVLCSPGCFSIFRASALMDDNVLRKYAEESKEPRQYIQFDQGEDRWLCTLLLQQGHRIEYCAAADAKTYAPEGFSEFFNQRRRWTPSTMANILDVLQSARRIRQNNNDISLLYILYQGFLFMSSVLTPGTIFLLVFSAINTAYPALPLYAAMLLNLVPVTIFIILLFTAKTEIQLAYAGILSILYALVMMVVLVGVFKQIVESSFCSMSAAFFLFIVGIFILAALLHPQEFVNVIHGFLYFLAIPCMSMLLMFYAFGNLNVVSWGTRETHTATVTADGTNPKASKNKKRSALHEILTKMKGSDDSDSDYVFSFGNLLRCICCPRPVLRDHASKMELLLEKMEDLESALRHRDDNTDELSDYGDVVGVPDDAAPFSKTSLMFEGEEVMRSNPLFHQGPDEKPKENDRNNIPRWTKDKILGTGDPRCLLQEEDIFWTELIEEHLKPLNPSGKEKQEMADGLTGLRNRVCTFFFLSNCLFVTLMFILESVSEYTPSLVFHLPCDTGDDGATREPVAIAFTLIFGVLLFIQFLCMLVHRFSTLLAIASITEVHFKSEATQEKKKEEYIRLIEDLYRKDNIGYEYDDNISIASSHSGTELSGSPGNTLTGRHNKDLMKRFLRDVSIRPPEKPLYLDAILKTNMQKVVANIETFEGLGQEEDNAKKARKLLPGASSQSLFVIAQMAKDKDKQEKMKRFANAQQKWKQAYDYVHPSRTLRFAEVALSAVRAKRNQDEEESPLEVKEDTTDAPSPSVPTRGKSILKNGGANLWKMATGKVVSKENDNEQNAHSPKAATSTEKLHFRSVTHTSNGVPSRHRYPESKVTVESHTSDRSSMNSTSGKDEGAFSAVEMSEIVRSDIDDSCGPTGTGSSGDVVDSDSEHLLSRDNEKTEL